MRPMIFADDTHRKSPVTQMHRVLDLASDRRLGPLGATKRSDHQIRRAPSDQPLAGRAACLGGPFALSSCSVRKPPGEDVDLVGAPTERRRRLMKLEARGGATIEQDGGAAANQTSEEMAQLHALGFVDATVREEV